MKRRGFLRVLVRGGLALGAASGIASIRAGISGKRSRARALPRRFTEAVRAKRYPGPVVPLDHEDVMKPGRWAG